MKRYYPENPEDNFFDPDENDEEEDDVPEGLVEEIAAAIGKEDIVNAMQFDLAHLELNQDLLNQAITIASNNARWGNKSNKTKLKEIEEIYKRLRKLTTDDETEEGTENGSL